MRNNYRFFIAATFIGLILCTSPLSFAASEASPTGKRILVLYSHQAGMPWDSLLHEGLSSAISGNTAMDVTLDVEYLDLARNPSEQYEDLLIRIIEAKYANRQPDIIISDLDFITDRILLPISRLLPAAKIILLSDEAPAEDRALYSGRIASFYSEPLSYDSPLTLIEKLLPDIRHIYFITGNSPQEQKALEQAKRSFGAAGDRFDFIYCVGLPLEDLLDLVSRIPENSAIIFDTYFSDTNQIAYVPAQVLETIHERAMVPIFGMVDLLLGRGIVGGKMNSAEQLGREAGLRALEILANPSSGEIENRAVPSTSMFDWRELKRWHIDPDQLPEGSIIRYRQFSFFQQYKWHILLGGCIVVIQSLLIVSLLIAFSRRKTAEKEKAQLELALQQAQKMESIGTLAGGIAHDFNNILAAIIGYTEFALMDIDAENPLASTLRKIMKAGIRARDLVSQILTFARRDHETVAPTPVLPIAREALTLLRSTIPASVEIRQKLESNASILADPAKLHQVFMNICINASQSMANGGLLEISVTDVSRTNLSSDSPYSLPPDNYVKITISDTGSGISKSNLDLIFEPYFTTKGVGSGTGLGLSVVHGIVKGYGGEISVESEPNVGTVFTIFFPITREKPKKITPSPSELSRGSEHILVVDDEPAIVDMLTRQLVRLGYRVTSRTGSPDALALFRNTPDEFDLVITDMTMPVFCGDVLARKIKEIRPDIPILLCTGYNKQVSRKAPDEIIAVLMKPIELPALMRTIQNVLDKNGTGMKK